MAMDQFVNLFRDPIWTFIGVMIAVVMLVVTLIIARSKQPQLTYQLIDFELAPKERPNQDVPVTDSKITIRIWNSGTASITCRDYEHCPRIAIQYFNRTHIHLARIARSSPPDIKELNSLTITPKETVVEPVIEGGKPIIKSHDEIVLPPMLFNPKDAMTLEAWITPPSQFTQFFWSLFGTQVVPTITVIGRIEGVRQIQERKKGSAVTAAWVVAAIGVIVALLAASFLPLPFGIPEITVPVLLLAAVTVVAVRWRAILALRGVLLIIAFVSLLFLMLLAIVRNGVNALPRKPGRTPT